MKNLEYEVRKLVELRTLLPNKVNYKERLLYLFETGRKGLSLAKLAEAYWDALSILYEVSYPVKENALYAVWASEIPNNPLKINRGTSQWTLAGTKMFCSGAGLVDRADAHTLAHIAAMESNSWAIRAILENSGNEVMNHLNIPQLQKLALGARHVTEQLATDI